MSRWGILENFMDAGKSLMMSPLHVHICIHGQISKNAKREPSMGAGSCMQRNGMIAHRIAAIFEISR